jgi:hypothetical protein
VKRVGLASALAFICLFGTFFTSQSILPAMSAGSDSFFSSALKSTQEAEGPLTTVEMTIGPFDLHRKYRSMEGPYVREPFCIADLLASGKVQIPENLVHFVEGTSKQAPSMSGDSKDADSAGTVPGLKEGSSKRELLWLKSVKLEVLDENDKVMPTAEFFCHSTIDVDLDFRKKAFPESEHPGSMRHIVLSQGQTELSFPRGFGLPVASDETWRFIFQSINRESDRTRRVKQRCILTFVRDSELVYPIKALFWYYPVINVVIDRNSPEAVQEEHNMSPDCSAMSEGVAAPSSMKSMIFTDELGRKQIGHWVVPPGTHVYASPVSTITSPANADFAAQNRRIQYVMAHVHPYCEKLSLMECNGKERKEVISIKAKTLPSPLQIMQIDTLSSSEGIPLAAGKHYELEAKYVNATARPQDSMAGMAIYCVDTKFVRPDWAYAGESNPAYCGTPDCKSNAK